MDLKRERATLSDINPILRQQLNDTLQLADQIRLTEAHFRSRNIEVMDLLSDISLEVQAVSDLLDRRCSAHGNAWTMPSDIAPLSPYGDSEGSLELLLNRFCKYERNTSSRLIASRRNNDREAVLLFDRILSLANRSIWFLDIYSDVVRINCLHSRLPGWKPVFALRHMDSLAG
jgi:hypothetical protein